MESDINTMPNSSRYSRPKKRIPRVDEIFDQGLESDSKMDDLEFHINGFDNNNDSIEERDTVSEDCVSLASTKETDVESVSSFSHFVNEHYDDKNEPISRSDSGVFYTNTFGGKAVVTDSEGNSEIVSPKGTVRGVKNRVRAGIATFLGAQPYYKPLPYDFDEWNNYADLEQGKIILYSTSLAIVRDVYEKCKVVRNILFNHMIRYEERDLCLNRELIKQIRQRLGTTDVPQVFVDGKYLGDWKTIVELNETGELRKIFSNYEHVNVSFTCKKCGGYRYVPCCICHGSKKSLHRNSFTEQFSQLKCTICNENGLIRCDLCMEQQE